MFKNQTRGRQMYAAVGGRIGLISIITVIIVIVIVLVLYVRKIIIERRNEKNDFLRFQRLMKSYLKITRENQNFGEDRVELEMTRFEYSSVLIPVGDASIGQTWDTDSEVFGDLCKILQSMMSYGSDRKSVYYKNTLLWNQIVFAIRTIAAKLPDIPAANTVPWGTNWYQFSITYPTFLVATAFAYLETFNKEDAFITRHLASYINNYFKESKIVDGIYSMGWLRTESNVIGMSVPVIGGRLYSNRFNPEANSQIYARDYMSINWVYSDNGFYYDNTYITHISRNDGYTTSFYYEFIFVYDFYRMKSIFFDVIHRNFSITEHPDIPLHHGPWFNRGAMMKGFTPGRKFAHYGLDIRGFERGVSLRTKTISLQYCGQMKPLAAYEADRVNKEWAQCWVFMRRPLTINSADRLYKELVPYYDAVHSYGLRQIDWASTMTTTAVFIPDDTLCSLVYIQDKVAGMYNKYNIKMADQYKFDIEEISMLTPDGIHLYYTCKVDVQTASKFPYTIACHLGTLDPGSTINSGGDGGDSDGEGEGGGGGGTVVGWEDEDEKKKVTLTGVGAKYSYAFDNFIGTFLYLDDEDLANAENVIKHARVTDPNTSEKIDALYVQPIPRQTFKFGFSNNFYKLGSEHRHNSLLAAPTMNTIFTENYKLEKMDTKDALIFLHDYTAKMSVISYAYNYTLPQNITVKKNVLDKKFSQYQVVNGIFNSSTNEYTVNTYEKQFQMVLKNVVFKDN